MKHRSTLSLLPNINDEVTDSSLPSIIVSKNPSYLQTPKLTIESKKLELIDKNKLY